MRACSEYRMTSIKSASDIDPRLEKARASDCSHTLQKKQPSNCSLYRNFPRWCGCVYACSKRSVSSIESASTVWKQAREIGGQNDIKRAHAVITCKKTTPPIVCSIENSPDSVAARVRILSVAYHLLSRQVPSMGDRARYKVRKR